MNEDLIRTIISDISVIKNNNDYQNAALNEIKSYMKEHRSVCSDHTEKLIVLDAFKKNVTWVGGIFTTVFTGSTVGLILLVFKLMVK